MLERFIERVIVENEWGLRARICDIYHAGWRHKKYWMSMTLSLAYRVNRMLLDQGRVDLTGIVTMRLYTNERVKMGFPFQQIHDVPVSSNIYAYESPSAGIYKDEELSAFYQNKYTTNLGTILIGGQPFDVLAGESFEIEDGVEYGNFEIEEYIHHRRWLHLCPHAASYSAKPLK